MEPDRIYTHLTEQRSSLADLLAGLSPTQWQTPSLCGGWTVKDVAAHVSAEVELRRVLPAMIRARGNFDTMIHDSARERAAARSTSELIDDLRLAAHSRRRPPGTSVEDPLIDVAVHGQDITRPLQIQRAIPRDVAVMGVQRVWLRSFPYRARKRFAGLRFEAADAPVVLGEGPVISGPVAAILLTLTGRAAALDELEGPGVEPARRTLSAH